MIETKDGRTIATKREEFSPEEEDAIAKEVNEDIRAGKGYRHFQDVLDGMFSNNESRARDTGLPDADEQDRIAKQEFELCRDLKQACTRELIGHGMRVLTLKANGKGTGFLAVIKDAEHRHYDAELFYDEAAKLDLSIKPHEVFRAMVGTIVDRALEARKKYFQRACIAFETRGEDTTNLATDQKVRLA